ncbi:hypothetical protein ACQPYK_50035 (plasmid) [Streptosporangium sp. CA-135522]|uniref:hypothetical protein n=1 Tax=Streptosporangium sp. CA-135522 TaxID=3240072 RepID=UPI003D8F1E8F
MRDPAPLPLPPLVIYRSAVVLWCGRRIPPDGPPVADIAWVHTSDDNDPLHRLSLAGAQVLIDDIERVDGQNYDVFRGACPRALAAPPLVTHEGAAFFLSAWWQSGPRMWWADLVQIIDDRGTWPRRPRVIGRRVLAAQVQRLDGQDYRAVPRLGASA